MLNETMTPHEERQPAAVATTVAWLEEELRETKAALGRQQQAIEQLNGHIWDLATALHRTEDSIAALAPRLDILPEYDAVLHQIRDQIARLHEHGLGADARVADLFHAVQGEAERDREILNEFAHRLEAAERTVQQTHPRFEAIDEAARRTMEAVALLRQHLAELQRSHEATDTRLSRSVEAAGRTEHEFARLNGEVESLRRQDAAVADRVQVYTEMVKRLEAQISAVAADVTVKQDLLERIQLARVELHRVEERTAALEAVLNDLRQADDEAARQLSLLQGRDRGLNERLIGLQSEFATYRTVVAEQFQRLQQAQERAKRRQIEDLEREIREMRIHGFRPLDE
jgi:chromosome segregation ATPase